MRNAAFQADKGAGKGVCKFKVALRPQRPYGLLETPISTFTQLLSSDLKSSVLLYVHRDRTDRDVGPRTATSTFTQPPSSDLKSSVLLYVHRDRTDRDVGPRTATSTFTQPLSSELYSCLL